MHLGLRSTIFLASATACAAGAAAFLVATAFGDPLAGTLLSALPGWVLPTAAFTLSSVLAAALAASFASRGARAASVAADRNARGETGSRVEVSSGPLEVGASAAAFDAKAAESDRAPGRVEAPAARESQSALKDLVSSDEALVRETRMALRIQRRIVPTPGELPTRPELAFGAAYIPADNTGGDLYDAVRAGKNGYAFLVADVAGRGVPAALVSAMVKNSFRSKATWHADAARVMEAVNEELVPVLCDTENFVTAFYAVLDLENGTLSYANAGHPPALLMRRRLSGTEDLDGAGAPLGIRAGESYAAGHRRLEEGDRIVFFTDGVSSSRNFRGEEFSRERLASAIADGSRLPVSELATALAEELEAFSIGAPRGDDTVIMICEFRSFARPPGAEPSRPSRAGDDDYPSLSRKGAFLASTGKVAEAARVYERLLELEPEDATALSNLGTLYWKMGRRAEAARRFRDAARLDPQDPRIARNLALAERSAVALSPKAGLPRAAASPGASPGAAGSADSSGAGINDSLDDVEEAEPVDDL